MFLIDYRDGSEDGLTFAFRFTDATISIPNQGMLSTIKRVKLTLLLVSYYSWKNHVAVSLHELL